MNFLFWAESARYHVDDISDVAGQVAWHINNQTQQKYFQPVDGQLCAPLEQNIQVALKKTYPGSSLGSPPSGACQEHPPEGVQSASDTDA